MMISFWIEDQLGRQQLELPGGIEMSLMEVLQAAGCPIPAICGGIALCATCCVEVISGADRLSPSGGAEIAMLENLPIFKTNFRLSCQLRLNETLNGCVFRLTTQD